MLYILLSKSYVLFSYITFRAIMAAFTTMLFSYFFYPKFIKYLKRVGAGEAAKEDAPESHLLKAGTPTMGGVGIVMGILFSSFLWADFTNKYIIASLLFLVLFSAIGLVDDLIKLNFKRKRDFFLKEHEKEWLDIHEENENSNILSAENNNKKMGTFLGLVFEFISQKIERDEYQEQEINSERREIYKNIKDDIYKLYFIRGAKKQILEIKKVWKEKNLNYSDWYNFVIDHGMKKENFQNFQNDIIYFFNANFPRKYDENIKLENLITSWFNWISIPKARQELTRKKSSWIAKFKKESLKNASFMVKLDGLGAKFRLLLEFAIVSIILVALLYFQDMNTLLQVPIAKNWTIDLGYLYIPFGVFVIVGFANAVNLTDGLDGLSSGSMMIAMGTLTLIVYLSGHKNIAEYLHILYIQDVGELAVFGAIVTTASIGFLWFNAKPADIFMGDVGSLGLGASFGALLVMSKNEILGLILGGIFVMEVLSVVIQVAVYKRTKKRVFRMAPIHHHFEKLGIKESKIVIRFWLIGFILALIAIATLKVR